MCLRGRSAIAGILILLGAATASGSELRLTIKDGTVTLVAKDVPARQILAEWARVGKTKIVNGERVPGPPLTLELINVPEARALETVLRTVSGFMAAQRTVPDADASVYDRIVVMPTAAPTTPTANAAQRAGSAQQQFRLQQPGFMRGRGAVVAAPPDPDEGDDETADEELADDPDEDPAEPSGRPTAPAGLRQPGMVSPTAVPPHPLTPFDPEANATPPPATAAPQFSTIPGVAVKPPPKPPKSPGGQ